MHCAFLPISLYNPSVELLPGPQETNSEAAAVISLRAVTVPKIMYRVRNYMRDVRRVLVGKPEGAMLLGRARRRWEIILRWIFRKWDGVVGTGWSRLKIGTGGGHL
jgi:hypothetical protein